MATWLKKTWIEQALLSREEESLPRIARAQILKLEETSTTMIGIISDKKLFMKASFSQAAVDQFKRDNPSLSMSDIQGGLIFVKKYAVEACMDSKSGYVEFMLKVDQFKFAGGEGNTQFGSNLIDCSSYGPLLPRLQELWLQTQLCRLVQSEEFEKERPMPSLKEVEKSLLGKHNLVFVPDDMEKKLNEIAEWQPRYCPPQVQGEFLPQLDTRNSTSNARCRVSCVTSERGTCAKAGESVSEESNDAVINSDCISSSQESVAMSYPLRGLVTEEHCSSSSESSQVKTNSDESYSILAERSCVIETSPTVSVIASSNNTQEKTEIAQVFPYITPQMTDNHVHCSLAESQPENLLDTSISSHDVTSTPCFENVPNASQVGKTNINVGTEHDQNPTPCRNKLGNGNSSSKQLDFDYMAVSDPYGDSTITACQPGVSSSLNSTGKKFIFERVVSQTTGKCFEFDALYNQNTRTFSQECEQECSGDLAEFNQHQSGKRKRSEIKADKAQLNDSPVSPKNTSSSVKSSSHSDSSRGQHSNHSSSICLAQPLGLYSQQDPLVLDTSTDSTESTGGVIDNVSGFLISREAVTHTDKSHSALELAAEEPCTLTTPTFDSLPSFQVPVVNRLPSPDDTSPANHQKSKLIHSCTWHQETEARQQFEPEKKKRKPRRRKFNWFSDAY